MKTTLGIDPSVRDLAIASWNDHGPGEAWVVHVPGKKAGNSAVRMAQELLTTLLLTQMPSAVTAIAIEGQQIDGRRAKTANLFTLAHVSGAALFWVVQRWPHASIGIPTPSEWKGGVAKHAHQARLYADLGWDYTIVGSGDKRYARPVEAPPQFSHVTPVQWKEVGDALLLARWAYEHA